MGKKSPHFEFHRFNPLRQPYWRYERVLQIFDQMSTPRLSPRDDKYVGGLKKLLPRFRNASVERRKQLSPNNPGLHQALTLFWTRDDDPAASRICSTLEARLLAGESNCNIATMAKMYPDTVEWYAELFFDVRRDLVAHDWVLNLVLIPAYLRGGLLANIGAEKKPTEIADNDGNGPVAVSDRSPHNPPAFARWLSDPFFDPTLKFFAYYGGPAVMEMVLSGFQRLGRCPTATEAARWFDKSVRNTLRRRTAAAAMRFEVTHHNVMTLFNTHNLLLSAEYQATRGENGALVAGGMDMSEAMAPLMEMLGFSVGDAGTEKAKGTLLEPYDKASAELSFSEAAALSSGASPDTIKNVLSLRMPEPPKREDPVLSGTEGNN